MIAVVQRVDEASVSVDSPAYEARIGRGLCVLLAVERGDGEAQAEWIAGKIARLRIFPDEQDKMNRSVRDIAGAVLLVSQFTLAGNCTKGNRPSFAGAAEPPGCARRGKFRMTPLQPLLIAAACTLAVAACPSAPPAY